MYAFIPIGKMTDPAPSRFVATGTQAASVFNQSTVLNHVTVQNNKVFNQGVRPDVVETAAHAPVRRATIQETPAGSNGRVIADRVEKRGNNVTIYRPSLSSVNSARSTPAASALRLPPVAGTPTPAIPAAASVAISKPPTPSATPAINDGKRHVEVYQRPENVAAAKPTQAVQVPRVSVSGGTAASLPQVETYPPNSIVLRGPQSPATAAAVRAQQESYRADTSFHFQVPRSQLDPPAVQAYTAPANNSGSIFSGQASYPNQAFGRSEESQPANPQGQGNGFNRGFGNSPNVTTSPRASFTPAQPQAPVMLPSRSAYSAPASQPAPSFTPRAQNFAPAQSRQEIQLPPQQHYSAPAPAPAPAPAQPSHSSSQSSGGSASSGSSSGGGRGR
jgi:hypothetical protein